MPNLFVLFSAVAAVLAAPGLPPTDPATLIPVSGPAVPDSYIVVLKPDVDRGAHMRSVFGDVDDSTGDAILGYEYSETLSGYSAILSQTVLDTILADPAVAYVVPDSIASIDYPDPAVSSVEPICDDLELCSRDGTNSGYNGEGVDIYSLDTGVYVEHNDFEGRARRGASFGPWSSPNDGNGHGTHTSSTAAGKQWGTAPAASIIAIKVLSDQGTGSYSGIIAGIDWATRQSVASGKPSIINASLGGPRSQALDDSVEKSMERGVHFVVAAGNSSDDADKYSPADVRRAVTVGAVDRQNRNAYFSNYGPALDVFALGVSVTAAWIGSPDAIKTISGTSMATPAVSGTLAIAISKYGNSKPQNLQDELKKNARRLVTGQPNGTTNLLATIW